ncbi:hypothetical protein B0T24DRAFT_671373 [Lasiosphaeria ovina]|uniref:Uncharacterized protein n=1 Tax=Lasiosphaeria ovina TaxID=92902 RepID=A0AAE0JV47_9PEZI|nr:hypothetical protein B0T24DRAFT_671373 [Lasiosphaeria ovina]
MASPQFEVSETRSQFVFSRNESAAVAAAAASIPPISSVPDTRKSSSQKLVADWIETSASPQPIPCPSRSLAHRCHPDSGYVTGNNTSFVSPAKSSNFPVDARQSEAPTVRSVPLPGREDLLAFRVEISDAFNARFREIVPELERLLQKHMQKGTSFFPSSSRAKTRKQTATSMRLMTIGDTLANSKPSIVIFVCGQQTSNLDALFSQPLLRQLYQPDDGITPSFPVVVVGEAPRKRLLEDVSVVWDTSVSRENELSTYCGVQIHLETKPQRSVTATLGGVVKLTFGPGNFALVGMTAGHVLEELLDTDTGEFRRSEAAELKDPETEPEETWQETYDTTPMYRRLQGELLYPNPETEHSTGKDICDLIPPRDWSLFAMDAHLRVKPNLLQKLGPERTLPEEFPESEPMEVVMLNSANQKSQAAMLGVLSPLPGGFMLDPSKGFVNAYLLTLDEREDKTPDQIPVQDGDSGSWVVNPISMKVYGHVVATDFTGDAYVIPLHSTLAEMREVLDIESVDLPTTADLLDAALRASTGTTRSGTRQDALKVLEFSQRERRASEVISLCEGRPNLTKELGFPDVDDNDSGYGSVDAPKDRIYATSVFLEDEDDDYSVW